MVSTNRSAAPSSDSLRAVQKNTQLWIVFIAFLSLDRSCATPGLQSSSLLFFLVRVPDLRSDAIASDKAVKGSSWRSCCSSEIGNRRGSPTSSLAGSAARQCIVADLETVCVAVLE